MKDLYRCLAEYSPAMLQAIADAWQLALAHDKSVLEQVEQIAAAMLVEESQGRVFAMLSDDAQAALQEVMAQDGMLPGHRLRLRYGAIRRFGPARLERERPWTDPANAVEELYYKGLVYRVYGTAGGQHGEMLLVPEPLLGSLPKIEQESACELAMGEDPAQVYAQGSALAEDVLALLVRLRQAPLPGSLSDQDQPRPVADWAAVDWPDLGLAGRWQGSDGATRLAFIWRMAVRLRLISEKEGRLEPSLRARDWLKLDDRQRMAGLATAWRDDSGWDELRHQPGLVLEDTGWKNDPQLARRNLLRFLDGCPRHQWVDMAQWLVALKGRHPDYMRPDGDLESWFIRDAETGNYLSGAEAWDQVEGTVARSMILHELHWLGLVDLGMTRGGQSATLFMLNEKSDRLWDDAGARRQSEHEVRARIGDEMVIDMPTQNSMYQRYQLERFAEWQSQGEIARYKITAESIWASQNAGIKIEQILSFLGRISGDQVPGSLTRSLQAWGGRFGRVFVRRVLVLQTVDQETMRQLRKQADTAALLGQELSPTACLVQERDVEMLTARLKSLGIWPHIKL